MKNIGYVLSGGGARGFAHVGVLKLLEELGIRPYAIAGTSAGAIVGVLYASGKSPGEILEIMKKTKYFGWSNLLFHKDGFFSMSVLRNLLIDVIGSDDFETLKIKLFVTATDINEGKSVIFSKGKLFDVVVSSASIPVLFEPVLIADKFYVDGGVLNNFPVEPLLKICDCIIGSHVNQIKSITFNHAELRTANIIDRCFHLSVANSVYSKFSLCDVFIEPPLTSFNMFDISQADKIFQIGYNTALQHANELKELVGNK